MRIGLSTIGGGPWPLLQSPAVAVRELSTPPTRLASPSIRDWRSERARWNRLFCLWFLRYRGPWFPCALPAMAAGALTSVRHGGAGGGVVPRSASTAAAQRDSRGGPEPDGYSWALCEALEPSRCVARPRQPDLPGPVAPGEAQPRVSRTPIGPWLPEPSWRPLRSQLPLSLSASQARPRRWVQTKAFQFASYSSVFSKAFVLFPWSCVGSPNTHPLRPPVLSLPVICLPTASIC